jgi:hypothetical protein
VMQHRDLHSLEDLLRNYRWTGGKETLFEHDYA